MPSVGTELSSLLCADPLSHKRATTQHTPTSAEWRTLTKMSRRVICAQMQRFARFAGVFSRKQLNPVSCSTAVQQ